MSGRRRLLQVLRDGWTRIVHQPNLMLGTGALLAAALLAIVFRPVMRPQTHRPVVMETTPPIVLTNPDLPRKPLSPPPPPKPPSSSPSGAVTATPAKGDMPVVGRIVAGYGFVFEPSVDEWDFHPAWDIAGKIGEVVKAAFSGVVTAVGPDPALGLSVTIRSGMLKATYAGLQDTALVVGESVREGQAIGAVGKSGPLEAGEGPHLHFALTENGQSINPSTFVTP